MKKRFFQTSLVLPALLLLGHATLPSHAADAPASILANGDLETDKDGDGWPDGWPRQDGVSWENENGNHFLRLQQKTPGTMLMLYQPVPVSPENKSLEFHLRVRYANVVHGKENWNDARFIFHFKNAAREQLNPDPAPIAFLGDSNGWVERTLRFQVPDNAMFMEIMPSLFQPQSGTMDIDDLRLVPGDGGASGNSVTPATAPEPEKFTPPPPLHVAGNQITTADGKAVWLQGVNVPSLDWMPEGEHILPSIKAAIEDWKCNVIRLPVNDDYWFGRGPRQKDGGKEYRDRVDEAVRAIEGRGTYVVLDLHKYRAPQASTLDFWKEAATHFKDNPAVLFDILNEPHDISWDVWRNGGTVEDKPRQGDTPAVTYQSPGMQRVVDAVRATGAHNIIVAGGLDWAYDLSGILKGYSLDDKGGNGIVYAAHVYSWKSDWQHKVLDAAQKYPVLLGEVGCDTNKIPGINNQEDPYTWAPDMLGFIQKYKLNWTAWSFHTGATPRILADWDYNPTPFWGAWIKAALLGARFEMQKMR